jgi:hypothetical protein
MTIYIPFRPDSGYTIVFIKKVFKGQLKYHTTRLYDDTWYFRGPIVLGTAEFINTPRESWYDDARYDGMSADGQRATFQYGPVNAGGPINRGGRKRLGDWSTNEWKTLPAGVQVESRQMDSSETSK